MDSSIKLVCLCVKSSMCSKLPSALCISDLAIYIPTCIRIHVYVLCNVLRPYVANTPCMSYCTINKLHAEQLIASIQTLPTSELQRGHQDTTLVVGSQDRQEEYIAFTEELKAEKGLRTSMCPA